MATFCPRCNEQLHGLPKDQPHLCKDVQRRLRRREKQRDAVVDILRAYGVGVDRAMRSAEEIVAKLANMGVEED